MLKFVAPKVLKVNNYPSPCYCEDNIVCEYCVQANLILYEKEQVQNEEVKKAILGTIKRNGIKKPLSRFIASDKICHKHQVR